MLNGHDPDRARSALLSIDPGCSRPEWVRAGMAAKSAGLSFEDFHAWSATASNYRSEADCRSTWNSMKGEGIGPGSLFAAARAAGWQEHNGPQQRPHQTRQKPAQGPQRPEQDKRPPFDVEAAWEAGEPATAAHGYIDRKAGSPAGLKVYRGPERIAGQALDGALMVPAWDFAGKLQTLQFIPDQGKKLNAPGRPVAGAFVVGRITPPGEGQSIAVCEGIGQAWSCNAAAGMPAVVASGAGRMEQVARDFAARYPAARLVLVADAGKEQHCADLAKRLHCAWVEMPAGSPSNFDANDLHQRDGLDALAELLHNPKAPPQRFRLMTAEELAALPPVRWRVRGVLPQEGIAAVFGPSGSGKSFLVLDMLAAIASGWHWFGCRVKPCPVLYVGLEGEAGIAQRIQAHQKKHGRLAPGFRFLLQSLDIRKPDDRADLVAAACAAGYAGGVLVIDTLNRAAPGADENDAAAMGAIITGLKALQTELGGLVLAVHHTGKDATKGLRGHSSLHAALDAALEVTRTEDRREWRTAKAKDGSDDQGHPFRLEVVELGADEDGEPITSCAIAPEEPAADAIRRALPPKSGNQKVVLEVVQELLKANGLRRPVGVPAELPPGRPVIRMEAAIEQSRTRLVCEPKRQTERAQAAIRGLVERGLLVHREGWLWLA